MLVSCGRKNLSISMHRNLTRELLQNYLPRYPEEREVVEKMLKFLDSHIDCFERSLTIGHFTGSAWVMDSSHQKVLLTHHRKLDKWLQLGGHADGDSNLLNVALREATEESGIERISAISQQIFDVDIHLIPARGEEPEHYHYDVRFLLTVPEQAKYEVSDESHDLAWVPLDKIQRLTSEPSMLRMVRKSLEKNLG